MPGCTALSRQSIFTFWSSSSLNCYNMPPYPASIWAVSCYPSQKPQLLAAWPATFMGIFQSSSSRKTATSCRPKPATFVGIFQPPAAAALSANSWALPVNPTAENETKTATTNLSESNLQSVKNPRLRM